jgi:hypothetical protein
VAATAGVATFTGISVTQAGASAQLTATSGNVTATSASFTVVPGAVAAAQSTIDPAGGTLAAFGTNELLFTFRDQFNNPIPSAPVTITTALTGATLTPGSGTTTPAGTFTTSFQSSSTGTATFAATVNGTPLTLANTFLVEDVCAANPLPFPGNVSGVIPTGACMLNGFRSASHRFTTANEFVTRFTVAAPFLPAFEISANPPVDNIVLQSQGNEMTTEWLLPAGTYNARVGAPTGGGTYSLTGIVGVSDAGCSLRHLVVAGTYTSQRLQGDDCNTDEFGFFEPPDASRADFFAIQSARACTITMRSAALNAFLLVLDGGTGETITANDNGGGGVNGQDAQITLPACRSGSNPLVIVANHFIPNLGAYTLTITFGAPATAASLTAPVTGKRLAR